ncbi:hypothetical protein [Caenispirillum bisanense]|uniref:Uncharacterized protein n=1 Tax=Caenispirillum bisanense TaxID=414052 RepID=A0A286GWI0_9PROT|nr:hypothetical protein [Caenispirillum bisanense]SOD99895.1 hypothetical protein SAMN05421508_11079 [Caenispirillum bisanense]
MLGLLAGCAPALPERPSGWTETPPSAPYGTTAGGMLTLEERERAVDPTRLPRVTPRLDDRVDEDYARRVTNFPTPRYPDHVLPPDRDLPAERSWPPSRRELERLDESPFPRPAPVGLDPCPAGMVTCR